MSEVELRAYQPDDFDVVRRTDDAVIDGGFPSPASAHTDDEVRETCTR